MYTLKTEHSFDSAHFLSGYEGKCSNIHGHRWRVVMEIMDNKLEKEGQLRGMIVDFGLLKQQVKDSVDFFDHSLIIEKNTLKPKTLEALKEEDFKVGQVDIDEYPELVSKYRIMSVPFFIVFKNGEVAGKTIGVQSKEELLALIRG